MSTRPGVGPDRSTLPDVVVVGGGVAGLVVARDLGRAGKRVVLLEAGERLGGCVTSHEVAGLALDAGAESFATRSPAVPALLAELGLDDAVVVPEPHGAWVRLAGRTLPLPRTGVLGIPGRVWTPDVRRTIGLLGALRATADRWLPAGAGLSDGAPVSLGRLVRLRLGRRVLDRLVAPVVTGVHSAHPDQVDLDAVLPTLRGLLASEGSLRAAVASVRAAAPAGSAVAGIAGGMHRLVTAVADDAVAAGVQVRTGAAVDTLRAQDDGTWVLTLTGGALVRSLDVVVAVPGPVAVPMLRELAPEVRSMGAPADTGVVLATLVLDAPALDRAPRGTGVLVAEGAGGVRAKALTHGTAKWPWLAAAAGPGRHVVRLSYGRAGESVDRPGAELQDVALADAAELLGVPLSADAVVGFARTTWPGGLPQARPGHQAKVAAVRDALGRCPGLWACGAWLAGTGLASVVADARATAAAVLAAPPR